MALDHLTIPDAENFGQPRHRPCEKIDPAHYHDITTYDPQ